MYFLCCFMYCLFVLLYVFFVLFYVLFVCFVICIVCLCCYMYFFVLFYVLFVCVVICIFYVAVCIVCCKCVLLPPGDNPIAVKYISYHYGRFEGACILHLPGQEVPEMFLCYTAIVH
jgi:hypothetical protein